MITAGPGTVFTTAADGDMRRNIRARSRVVPDAEWATVSQVHGAEVLDVHMPGSHGAADGLHTSTPGLPLAVFTADCLGVVLRGDAEVAVVHAGWRGVVGGVVDRALEMMDTVRRVHIGPHIRSCCFEVGPEVAERFDGHLSSTDAGTVSVDLASAIAARLPVEPNVSDLCTKCGSDTFSHRRDRTDARLATVAWIP